MSSSTGNSGTSISGTSSSGKSNTWKYIFLGGGILLVIAIIVVIILWQLKIIFKPKVCPDNCSGNGSCSNGICTCNTGFSGTNCSTKVCPDNCSGKGSCSNGICTCNKGYTGTNCSKESVIPVVPCQDNCSNNGVCNNGICTCNTGFSGANCSIESVIPVVPCPDNCSKNGSCNNGICTCNNGYTGTNCSTEPPCGYPVCSGRGNCVGGKCFCNFPYSGNLCSITNPIYNLVFAGISNKSLGLLIPNGKDTDILSTSLQTAIKFEETVTIKKITVECSGFTKKASEPYPGNYLLFNIYIKNIPTGEFVDNFQLMLQNKTGDYSIPAGLYNFYQNNQGQWVEGVGAVHSQQPPPYPTESSPDVTTHNRIQAGQYVLVQYASDTADINTRMKVTLVCT